MLVHKIDKNGYYLDYELVDIFPQIEIDGELLDNSNYVLTPLIQPCYKPRWNGTEWVEELTQEEIDEIRNNQPLPSPTLEELAENVNLALIAVMELSLE